MKTGMYGFSPERWEYIWKNVDFWEAFIPSKNGHVKARLRQDFFESVGYKVIPYEDKGVSVGIYVMKKDEKRTYGEFSEDTEMQDKLGEFFDIKKPFRRSREIEKTSKIKPLRDCNCGNPLEKGKQLCTKCRKANRRKTKSAYYKKIVGSD